MRTPSPGTVVGILALFVGLGGTGYAVISGGVPDSQGVFHACVNKGNGKLRIVKAANDCRPKKKKFPGELAISWNQRGPQGRPGANGLDGTNGTNGTDGANGSNGVDGRNGDGAGVIARVRSTAEATTTDTAQPMTLSGASWTQASNEANQFLGEVVYDPPPQSGCSTSTPGVGGPFPGSAFITVKVNGASIGSASATSGDGGDVAVPITLNSSLFEPGTATGRTLTVEVFDNCGFGGGVATTPFQIRSVKVNVVGLR